MSTRVTLHADGLITYYRTDGEGISSERLAAIRAVVQDTFPDALPNAAVTYTTKSSDAQDAHEAITVTRPAVLAEGVNWQQASGDHLRRRWLYELIWRRTVACQMTDATIATVRPRSQRESRAGPLDFHRFSDVAWLPVPSS